MIALLLAGALVLATPDLTCRVRNSKGELVRSMARRAQFLRALGYKGDRVPKGYAVDHLVPLALGGCDVKSNLTLLPIVDWKSKTAWERRCLSCWSDGTYARLLDWALAGCATGRTPKELCR